MERRYTLSAAAPGQLGVMSVSPVASSATSKKLPATGVAFVHGSTMSVVLIAAVKFAVEVSQG